MVGVLGVLPPALVRGDEGLGALLEGLRLGSLQFRRELLGPTLLDRVDARSQLRQRGIARPPRFGETDSGESAEPVIAGASIAGVAAYSILRRRIFEIEIEIAAIGIEARHGGRFDKAIGQPVAVAVTRGLSPGLRLECGKATA